MRFLSLLKELGTEDEPVQTPREKAEEIPCSYQLMIDTEEDLKALIARLKTKKRSASTRRRPISGRCSPALLALGLACSRGKPGTSLSMGPSREQKVLSLLRPLLENPRIGFIGHNIKYDLHVLLNEGIALKKIGFDTLLASYLISPQTQRHNLDDLSLEKFGKAKIPIEELIGKGKKQITMDDVPLEKITEYCCEDVDYTLRLKKLFEKELEKLELTPLFNRSNFPSSPFSPTWSGTGSSST